MSDRFRDWAVSQMRQEVGGQISGAGLDRMALLKAKPAGDAAATSAARKLTARKRKAPSGDDRAAKDPNQR